MSSVELEFRDPYMELIESFSSPDEPLREMGRFSFVQIYDGHVRAQSEDNRRIFDSLAEVGWNEDEGKPYFKTPDGKMWAQMEVTPCESS